MIFFQPPNPKLIRNLSAVSLHKVVQVIGLAATVILVPRLFGAEAYGRFAFVLSLSYLGQILGDFGTLEVMGKFVPGFTPVEAARLYMRHLAFKTVIGLTCGAMTTAAALLLTGWMRLDWALLVGAGVSLHIVAWVPFQFSLGLNRVGTWMSEQAWRQWALLVLLVLLLPPLGLTGGLLALLAMELLFLAIGLAATRPYWRSADFRLDWPFLHPYLRFGFGFFLANLTTVALYRSGPLLVETLTGQSTQTGFFNLALGLFMLAYVTTGQFAQSLIPALSDFFNHRQFDLLNRWVDNFGRTGWLLGWLIVGAVWALADLAVPLAFGPEFAPAAGALKWLSLAIPPAVLLWAGNVTATVIGRGGLKFAASLAGLVLFVAGTVALTPIFGTVGTALALLAAVIVNAAILLLVTQDYYRPNVRLLSGSAALGLLGLAIVTVVNGG